MEYSVLLYFIQENLLFIVSIFVGLCIMYIPIYKKTCQSILDPLFLPITFSIFANTVPIFLKRTGYIDDEHFFFILFSEVLYWLFFVLFYPKKAYRKTKVSNHVPIKSLYGFLIVSFLLIKLYFYSTNGLPLFNSDRFAIVAGNESLLHLIMIIGNPLSTILTILGFYAYDNGNKRMSVMTFIIIIITSLLDGSKSFIMVFIYGFFYYNYFYNGNTPKIKYKYLVIICLTPLLTLSVVSSDALQAYMFRLFANGDIYWHAMPNNVIDRIPISNPILNMTHTFWSPFASILSINLEKSDTAIVGASVFKHIYGVTDGGMPNSRISILSWVYYRWSGLWFTILMAIFTSRYFSYLLKRKNKNIIDVCQTAILYNTAVCFITDPYVGFMSLLGSVIIILLLTCLTFKN